MVSFYLFQDNLHNFVPSLEGQMGGQMINVGGHFVSKQVGPHYIGINAGGGPPVPPPKPGSKGAEGAGGQGEGDHGKGEKGSGEWSPLKGWYFNF